MEDDLVTWVSPASLWKHLRTEPGLCYQQLKSDHIKNKTQTAQKRPFVAVVWGPVANLSVAQIPPEKQFYPSQRARGLQMSTYTLPSQFHTSAT